MANVKKVGDWARIEHWLKTLPARAKAAHSEMEVDALQAVAVEASRQILSSEIRPKSQKRVGVTLIETGSYVSSIQVYKHPQDTKRRYAGLPPTGKHPPSGLPWKTIWWWLRYGTSRMPARPHIDTARKAGQASYLRAARRRGLRMMTKNRSKSRSASVGKGRRF